MSSAQSTAASAQSAANSAASVNSTQQGAINNLQAATAAKNGRIGDVFWLRFGKVVVVYGNKSTTSTDKASIGTLPAEARPITYVAAPTATGAGYVDVTQAGAIAVQGGGGANYFSIAYMAAS